MEAYRSADWPIYPIEIMDEFFTITSVHDYDLNNDRVITFTPNQLAK